MLTLLIRILITIVIGAICFYLIDKFIRDGRLANLLKILRRADLSRLDRAAAVGADWSGCDIARTAQAAANGVLPNSRLR